MAQKVYITMTGIGKWPVLNSLWAAICCKGYVPDKIYLFVTIGREAEAQSLSDWIKILMDSYGKKVEPLLRTIEEGNFTSSGKKITAAMEEERAAGNEVAIDITPGRKAIISSALLSAWQKQVDHVYYLYLEDMRNASNPYPMIPFHLQHFVDLVLLHYRVVTFRSSRKCHSFHSAPTVRPLRGRIGSSLRHAGTRRG
jgi:hypothetical protein